MTAFLRVAAIIGLLAGSWSAQSDTRAISADNTLLVTPNEDAHEGVNIRYEPFVRPDNNIISGLVYGQCLRALPAVGGWYQVFLRDDDVSLGYASARYLRPAVAGDVAFDARFLDFGEGDAAVITVGHRAILVDGGPNGREMRRYLHQSGISVLDLVIVTGPEPDHWLGLLSLLAQHAHERPAIEIMEYWDPGIVPCSTWIRSDYQGFIGRLSANPAIRRHRTSDEEPKSLFFPSIPEVKLTILDSVGDPPNGGDCGVRSDDSILVLIVDIAGTKILFAADGQGCSDGERSSIGRPRYAEGRLLANCRRNDEPCSLLKADVLKVPDHGSDTSSTDRFVAAVHAKYAVISAHANRNLPTDRVIRRYIEAKAQVLRTDRRGGAGNDHIRCSIRSGEAAVSCRYETN